MPGRAPRMRTGSHIDLVLTRLRTSGVVTTSWARDTHGIAPHVLRSIISGLRRHGAQIETHGAGGELEYRLPPAQITRIANLQTITDADIFVTRSAVTTATTPATAVVVATYTAPPVGVVVTPAAAEPGCVSSAQIDRIKELHRKPHGRDRMSYQEIADILNREERPTRTGKPWTKQVVHQIVGRGLKALET